ncbi:MAG: hypothetical protein IT450_03705 [Phycisphaerales bacterium]|nr:hypothetical protein [Phycisphaerales bacterium]
MNLRANAATLVLALAIAHPAAADVRFQAIHYIPYREWEEGPYTSGYGINDLGEVCGSWDEWGPRFSFFWSPEAPTQLLDLGGISDGCPDYQLFPEGISNSGYIVGRIYNADCELEACIWSRNNGIEGLGFLPSSSPNSSAVAINDLDQVVGWSGWPPNESRPFLWSPQSGMISLYDLPEGHMVEVFDINNSSCVVGWAELASGRVGAARWTPENGIEILPVRDILGAHVATAVNNLGQIVGPAGEGFLWDPLAGARTLGRMTFNGALSVQCVPLAINDLGQVVGVCRWEDPWAELSFIWDEEHGMRGLVSRRDPCFRIDPRAAGMYPKGINNEGLLLIEGDPVAVYAPYLPGDLDEDGDVDLADLSGLLVNFGLASGAAYADGDVARCDRKVDLRDLAELLGNFGETLP